jgi:CheY-like chemotaxis protein
LIERIREIDPAKGGNVPAIALTAYAATGDRTKALRCGYQTHLTKPVEPDELVVTVASFAKLAAGHRGGEPRSD